MGTEQPALFEGEGNALKPGDVVRDVQGRRGVVHSAVKLHPRVYVQWDGDGGVQGPFSSHLEAELEKVGA
jgi:hypothetical protein